MKTNSLPIFFLITLSIFVLHFSTQGQVTDSVSSGRDDAKMPEAVEVEKKFSDLTFRAGATFKQGLLNMQDNRRSQADKNFNDAVETFLMSGINVSRSPKLQSCYSQLIETIYRIEFPSNAQPPQIRSLSATCNWSWNENDYKTADAVAKLILSATTEIAPTKSSSTLITSTLVVNSPTQGFNEQKFEVSPLDELAKLESMPEEQNPPKLNNLRPLLQNNGVRIIEAGTGDTLAKLAEREGVSAIELAKYNGLLPTSILSAGREIKIPAGSQSRQNKVRTVNTSVMDSKEKANCKTSTPPAIQNLRIGMTVDEVSKKLNKKILLKKLSTFSLETYLASISNLKGVRQLSLEFFRGKLILIKVFYDNSIEWNGISEFQQTISKTLNLPNTWQGKDSSAKQMFCTSFDIKINYLYPNNFFLTLTDDDAILAILDEAILKEKKEKEKQKNKKENFKP